MVDIFSGDSLLRKMKAAVPERNEHLYAFHELTDSVATSVVEWKECVEAWERDPANPNPFEIRGASMSRHLVKVISKISLHLAVTLYLHLMTPCRRVFLSQQV